MEPAILRSLLRWTRSSAAEGRFHLPLQYVAESSTFYVTLPRDVKAEALAVPVVADDDGALARLGRGPPVTTLRGLRGLIRALFRANKAMGGAKELDSGFEALRVTEELSAHLAAQVAMRKEHADRAGITYSLGDVLRHKKFGFRAVVVSWDRSARIDVSGWDGLVDSEHGGEQPFYDMLVATDDGEHFLPGRTVEMRYVAQENLEVVANVAERRISNEYTDQYMDGFNAAAGRFNPVETLQYVFPDPAYGDGDCAATSEVGEDDDGDGERESDDAVNQIACDVAYVARAARRAAAELGGDGWQRELIDDVCRPLLIDAEVDAAADGDAAAMAPVSLFYSPLPFPSRANPAHNLTRSRDLIYYTVCTVT